MRARSSGGVSAAAAAATGVGVGVEVVMVGVEGRDVSGVVHCRVGMQKLNDIMSE